MSVLDSAKEAVKDRIGHPVSGTFIISFFLYNYSLTLHLLSTVSVDQKVAIMKSLSFRNFLLSNTYI